METLDISYFSQALTEPERIVDPTAWVGHLPFAYWIVSLLKPKILVELGTQSGNSYSAFCQSIKSNNLDTISYAVDTWKGEAHAGKYGEEVYTEYKTYHGKRYSKFSTLLRMTFDEGLNQFSDHSIDLLHIDGLHTYEAVKHDFETWLPKLSSQAVVLFHDTNVYDRDFGVYKLWEELIKIYPGFSFAHSHGLGVLLVGAEKNSTLANLCNEDNFNVASSFFEKIGEYYKLKFSLSEQEAIIETQKNSIQESKLQLEQRDALILEKENLLAKQISHIDELNFQIVCQDQQLAEKTLLSKQRFLNSRELAEQKDFQLAEKDLQLVQKELLLHDKEQQLKKTIWQIQQKNTELLEKEKQFQEKCQELIQQIANVEETKDALYYTNRDLAEKRTQLAKLNDHFVIKSQAKLAKQVTALKTSIKQITKLIKKEAASKRVTLKEALNQRAIALRIARSGLFDKKWYLQHNPDVASAQLNPILHYISCGAAEGRDPHPSFSSNFYFKKNPDVACANINPLFHYLTYGKKEGRTHHASLKQIAANQKDEEISFSTQQDIEKKTLFKDDVRAIAIYLPQFHEIKENNEWWGGGFTEWTNVKRGLPFYQGHYQPHQPHSDIGYYNLDDASVLEKQVEMARQHGIHGFCYYYYWFNGKRLLEKPLDRLLSTGKPDFPFCFCWANENWTRTWDGGDKEILIEQEHSYENDERFIQDLIPALKDPRYIRVNNKPLLIIYRPGLLPDIKATAKHWREVCIKEGVGEIYLACMRSLEFLNPLEHGLDAAIQFPPANVPANNFASSLELKVQRGFAGHIFDAEEMRLFYSQEEASFPLIRSVCPSWDNTARRMERGTSWLNTTPSSYYRWLCQAIERTRKIFKQEERLVFINAWNEWGEGCHLEPDEKHGYAFLNATRKALQEVNKKIDPPFILVISHDAAIAGAQILTLNLLKEWTKTKAVNFKIICVKGGVLRQEFELLGETLVLDDYLSKEAKENAIKQLINEHIAGIYSSTVVNGLLLEKLRYLKVPFITHAHELQEAIERWAPGEIIKATIENSDLVLGGAPQVIDNLQKNHGLPVEKGAVMLDFIEIWEDNKILSEEEKNSLRQELRIELDDIVIFGCGTTDWRKGTDLFLKTAIEACKNNRHLKFIWIGGDSISFNRQVKSRGFENQILFLSNQKESRRYYYIGDLFFLSSREDPSPLVALEAANAELPIVCFSKAGDIPSFIGADAGITVAFENVEAAVRAILFLATNKEVRLGFGSIAKKRVKDSRGSASAARAILDIFKQQQIKLSSNRANNAEPLVSVIVPNYNHNDYLEKRLQSIENQTHRNLEIIILDDASLDGSKKIIQAFLRREPRARALFNEINSGSPFKQWRKGIEAASGKYIWIAESDDSADNHLVKELTSRLEADPSLSMATCQLIMMGESGSFGGTPDEWLSEFNSDRWKSDYTNNGLDEIKHFLSRKNTVLNASGVLIRNRKNLVSLIEDSMRFCADWLLWVRLLEQGNITYVAKPLNYWRINSGNARNSKEGILELAEGPTVIHEIGRILKWKEEEMQAIQQSFKERYTSSNE